MKRSYKSLLFTERVDTQGRLIALESLSDIPFEIKRIFYIYECSEQAVRGQHANRYSEFVLICISGSCNVRLFDGINETVVSLTSPTQGLYLPKMIWKDMFNFVPGTILLAIANRRYDPDEYIRDKIVYLKEVHSDE